MLTPVEQAAEQVEMYEARDHSVDVPLSKRLKKLEEMEAEKAESYGPELKDSDSDK